MKDWFKARNIWGAAISALPDEEAGRLAKAIWNYTMTGEITEVDGAGKGIFAMILLTLSQDEERDADISEKRSRATDGIRRKKSIDSESSQADQMISNDIKTDQLISNDDNKNKNKNKNIEQEQDKEKVKRETSRFLPPSVDQVAEYVREKGYNIDPEAFVAFYESKGWKVGNQPMKNWKATCVTWQKRNKESGQRSGKPMPGQQYQQRSYSGQEETLDDVMERLMRA